MLCLFVLLLQDGSTALHSAAYNNHPKIMKVLVTNDSMELDSHNDISTKCRKTDTEIKDFTRSHIPLSNATMLSDKATQPVVSSTSPAEDLSSSYNTNQNADQYSKKLAKTKPHG